MTTLHILIVLILWYLIVLCHIIIRICHIIIIVLILWYLSVLILSSSASYSDCHTHMSHHHTHMSHHHTVLILCYLSVLILSSSASYSDYSRMLMCPRGVGPARTRTAQGRAAGQEEDDGRHDIFSKVPAFVPLLSASIRALTFENVCYRMPLSCLWHDLTFSKVLSIVALYGKCTRALTFQNARQA